LDESAEEGTFGGMSTEDGVMALIPLLAAEGAKRGSMPSGPAEGLFLRRPTWTAFRPRPTPARRSLAAGPGSLTPAGRGLIIRGAVGESRAADADDLLIESRLTDMKEKILIVDDDANIRESVGDILEVEGYEISQAGSTVEAVSQVRRSAFDVILMDYNLTDGTGIDAIRQIRGFNVESQILMITGNASLDTAVKAIQESVDDFLTKPVSPDLLKRAISRSLEKMKLRRENRRLIEDLKKANDQMARLSAMKSKFMSMSSHDLSNSLMTLQVSFEMLAATITPDEDQKKRMVYIANGIRQLARLIEDLVDWASIEQGKFRLETNLFDPGAMVEETVVGPQARAQARGLAMTTEVQKGLPTVSADKKRLVQVLNNLLENAVRHTPKGGSIVVGAARDGTGVRFSVRDNGDGIAPADLERIFESFYQGAGSSGGRLGLGLSISREIVHSHKGRIWVESPGPGKGATFLFTLPASS
jgi:two-component system sensor histidine kinase/response regulator